MRLALSGLLTLLTTVTVMAADFPSPDQLPSRPGLPDPLVMFDGSRVTTKDEWFAKRRPELKALFQYYMYGTLPPASKVDAKVVREDHAALGGKATLREITLTVGPPAVGPIQLLLVVPNKHAGPAPAFVGLNFTGNHTLVADPAVRLPAGWLREGPGVTNHRATDAGRGTQVNTWALDQTIDRGYSVATFYYGDVVPDKVDPNAKDGPGPHEPGAIMLWAWGLMRAVDYLTTVPEIDAKQIAVVGHSRLGKAAIVAAAFDDRIALAIPLQAGCGGTSPSRGTVGESVQQINAHFPHWFTREFKAFNDHPDRLPFDQNCLAALVAPRPLLFSNATEDLHANPNGQFEVLKAAEPAYRLLGAGGLESPAMPPVGKLSAGTLGYFIRPGKHSMTRPDWAAFLDFADRHFRKGAKE
jgi:hypothetical protein